eukprot:288906-Heterocapsa_arctica.AAC.1
MSSSTGGERAHGGPGAILDQQLQGPGWALCEDRNSLDDSCAMIDGLTYKTQNNSLKLNVERSTWR